MKPIIYDKLSLLIKESEENNSVVYLEDYNLKCNNKAIYSFDYEFTTDEESMLDFVFNADNLGFTVEVGALMQQRISLHDQKSFFTKLFIFEKISETEKSFADFYCEYVPKLNTGAYDKEPKTASQLLEAYGTKYLKTDKDFMNTVKKIKEIRVVSSSEIINETAKNLIK